MTTKTLLCTLTAFALCLGILPAPPNDNKAYTGSAEFERMKSLVGTWEGMMDMGQGPAPIKIIYRVVAGGSAVEERTFADTPKEMVTMYHDKADKLVLTHYCMLHNQPAMKLKSSDEKSIFMDFDESCSVDATKEMHMHSMKLTFDGPDTITYEWMLYGEGKEMGAHPYTVKRVKKD